MELAFYLTLVNYACVIGMIVLLCSFDELPLGVKFVFGWGIFILVLKILVTYK